MPPRPRRTFRSTRPLRRRVWVNASGVNAGVAVAATSVNSLVSGSTYPGSTVVRTHIELQWPAVVAADFTQLGIIVGRDTDPVNNIPAPVQDPLLDWALNKTLYANSMGSGATIVTTNIEHIDLKSKRKLTDQGDLWLLCLQNENAAAATYRWSARTLILLA